MKKLLLSFCALFVVAIAFSQTETVNNPDFLGCNTKVIRITKVEVTPTETVLHVIAKGSNISVRVPAGTVLQDSKTGKNYRLVKSSGFPIDKYTSIGRNGTSFRLYFDPIDSTTQKVDYIEGYSSNDYVIYGIPVRNNLPASVYRTSQYKYDESCGLLLLKNDPVNSISVPVNKINKKDREVITIRIVKYLD